MTSSAVKYLVVFCFAFAGTAADAREDSGYSRQVVSLSITYQAFDQFRPWVKKNPSVRSANAVVVAGPRLLTTAQMVEDATLIQVKKHGKPKKVPAEILHVDREMNLTLIGVKEKGFFKDLKPVTLADRLVTKGVVQSLRWRNRQLEVSSSRARRVEVHSSTTGNVDQAHLILMTDFSDGGWAEPVFAQDKLVGLTVSQSKRNVTRVLPVEAIRVYLEGVVEEGPYNGLGVFGAHWQVNRDSAVAAWLGMEGDPYGITIRSIPNGATGDGILRTKDVLTSLGGYSIDADGFYLHPYYERIRFTNILMEGYRIGDTIEATVLRDGKRVDLKLLVKGYPADLPLVPQSRPNHPPSYIVAGGLVFRELDFDFLRAYGTDWKSKANSRLVSFWSLDGWSQRADRRRVIILTYVLPDAYNIGYHNLSSLIVTDVNGLPIDSIADMQNAFMHPEDGYHTITFIANPQRRKVVLDAHGFEEANRRILQRYNIPYSVRLEEKAIPGL